MSRLDRYKDPAVVTEVVDGVIAGDRRAIARALRVVDDLPELGRELVGRLHGHGGGAQILGITGNPGAGKSTVTDKLIGKLRAQGKRIAVLAVDPSSPFSGGAILGDRIRMVGHFDDDEVYIRSMATRGTLGGLTRSTFDSVRVLDAAGFDVILLETVGVGQDEVDIVRLADTTVVVLVPGLGDDVQAIKAGLLEIADIFLVNKADREGANDVERGLTGMLGLLPTDDTWEPPIVRSVATKGQGLDELLAELDRHREFLDGSVGQSRVKQRRGELFERLFDAVALEKVRTRLAKEIEQARADVVEAAGDPYATVRRLTEDL